MVKEKENTEMYIWILVKLVQFIFNTNSHKFVDY